MTNLAAPQVPRKSTGGSGLITNWHLSEDIFLCELGSTVLGHCSWNYTPQYLGNVCHQLGDHDDFRISNTQVYSSFRTVMIYISAGILHDKGRNAVELIHCWSKAERQTVKFCKHVTRRIWWPYAYELKSLVVCSWINCWVCTAVLVDSTSVAYYCGFGFTVTNPLLSKQNNRRCNFTLTYRLQHFA